jgi:hypothetical protein
MAPTTVSDPILAAAKPAEWAPPNVDRSKPNPFAAFAAMLAENIDKAFELPLTLDAKDDDGRKAEVARTLSQLRKAGHKANISVRAYTSEPDKDGKLTLTAKGTERITREVNSRGAETPAA